MPHPVIKVLSNPIALGYILHSTGKGSRLSYLFLLTFRKVPWALPWTTMRKYKVNDMWTPILMCRCVAPRMEDGKRKSLVCSWWLAGNMMHMFSQMKQNGTRPWAFLPPSPPLLNIEDLRDGPESIYLSDGRTRICKLPMGLESQSLPSKWKPWQNTEHLGQRSRGEQQTGNDLQWPEKETCRACWSLSFYCEWSLDTSLPTDLCPIPYS